MHDQNGPPIGIQAWVRLGWAGGGTVEIRESAPRWLETIKANTPKLGRSGMVLGSTPNALEPLPLHCQTCQI